MPSYKHLIEFLTTRANGDQPNTKSEETKESSNQRFRHRYDLSRGQTFTTMKGTRTCHICRGPHDIKNCQFFKARSAKTRIALIQEASLCTNCLGKGHTITQCSAGSCRICRRRHHTLLHREDIQVSGKVVNSRLSCSSSSSDRSLSDRSSGRSPNSPTPRSSRHSRRSESSPQSSSRSSPRKSRRSPPRTFRRSSSPSSRRPSPRTSPKRESHSIRTREPDSNLAPNPKRQGKQ
jgi:hypothetical protein